MKTVTQIAKEFNITRSSVHYWIYRGYLKAQRVGSQYIILDEEVARFRTARTQQGERPAEGKEKND